MIYCRNWHFLQVSTPARANGTLSWVDLLPSLICLCGKLTTNRADIYSDYYDRAFPHRYAHYDMNPSFSDWYSFGGWSKPAIKQYAGDQYFCSAGVDKNYY